MPSDQDLAETLRKLEALHARPGTEGERAAAGNALERIRARLAQLERSEPPQELKIVLPDQWARALFIALARRYGLTPFRLRGQRRNTVLVRAAPSFVGETLWPEFQQLERVLSDHLKRVTEDLIARAVHPDVTDASERSGSAAGADGPHDTRGASA